MPSVVWNFFEKKSCKLSRCNLCSQDFVCSGNTTNMLRHLKLKHKAALVAKENELKWKCRSQYRSKSLEDVYDELDEDEILDILDDEDDDVNDGDSRESESTVRPNLLRVIIYD